MKKFDRKKRNFVYLLLTILFSIITIYIFFNFPPDYNFKFGSLGLPILPLFFISLAILIFSVITFIYKERVQGVILVVFSLGYLFMRLIGLTHWIFLVMLIALFITVELFILKKK